MKQFTTFCCMYVYVFSGRYTRCLVRFWCNYTILLFFVSCGAF